MKSADWRGMVAVGWIAMVVFAYAVFVNYATRPGFIVSVMKAFFSSLKADYLK